MAVTGMKRVFATPEMGKYGQGMMRTLQVVVVLIVLHLSFHSDSAVQSCRNFQTVNSSAT